MTEPPPATTLSALTTRLLLLLGDTSANRFTSSITAEAWKLALAEYSYAVPNIQTKTFTVATAGREQLLPVDGQPEEDTDLFPGLISITQVLFPWLGDLEEQDPHERFYFYFTDGQPVLYIGGSRTPAVGDALRITYASSPHHRRPGRRRGVHGPQAMTSSCCCSGQPATPPGCARRSIPKAFPTTPS